MRAKVIIVLVAAVAGFWWIRNERMQHAGDGPKVDLPWVTDASAALAKARTEQKAVIMNFTGSDWCSWCKRLDKEVFSTPEFASYANQNLVLLKLDFPRASTQSDAEKAQNEKLARQYGVEGFPTIVVLTPDGQEKGRLGYQRGGPEAWLESLQKL